MRSSVLRREEEAVRRSQGTAVTGGSATVKNLSELQLGGGMGCIDQGSMVDNRYCELGVVTHKYRNER